MSRNGNKAGRRPNRHKLERADFYDVTLNDFANSSVANSERMKKNKFQMNQVVKEVKQLHLLEDSQTWEEKLNAFETLNKEKELYDNDDDGDEYYDDVNVENNISKKLNSRRRKRAVAVDNAEDQSGVDYPIDIWFLISEYINPEDVGKFAAICKTSLAVVSTAKFWFNLYKRYYKRVPNLPERFQPECMVRRYGLRAHVIRALHFMYPPFVAKLKPQVLFEGDPHLLTKRLCVLAWSQKIKNYWIFCFKLKQPSKISTAENNGKSKPDLLELLEDITANVDDNCKVLQVTCLNYIILPMLSGQILSSVSLNVAQGMRYHKLQLNFGSGPFPNASSNPMILEPVVNVRILDWWHPSFPHSDGLNTSLFTSEATQQFEDLEF